MTRAPLAALALAAVSLGWLDPHAKAREAARLYAEGKYEDAVAGYNEALTDEPDSALLHFNLGDAAYKQGKFDDALKAFAEVPAGDADPVRTARVAYNVGNAKYRLGAAAEASDPKAALENWAEALAAYRRAMGAAPDDPDPKFNHEFVAKKIADLKKKLEEQQKQQEQQQQDQKNQQKSDEEKKQDEQQQKDSGQQQEQKEQEKKPEQQQADQQQQQQKQQEQPKQESAGAGEEKQGEMNQQEAAALLDSQRGEEVQPDEVTKRLQGAVVGEPSQDW